MPTNNNLKYPLASHDLTISIFRANEFSPDDLLIFLSKVRAVKVFTGVDGQKEVTKELKDVILQTTTL